MTDLDAELLVAYFGYRWEVRDGFETLLDPDGNEVAGKDYRVIKDGHIVVTRDVPLPTRSLDVAIQMFKREHRGKLKLEYWPGCNQWECSAWDVMAFCNTPAEALCHVAASIARKRPDAIASLTAKEQGK